MAFSEQHGRDTIAKACTEVFAELRHLQGELGVTTGKSTIMTRMINVVKYTVDSNIEDTITKAAEECLASIISDLSSTVEQCLEAAKLCTATSTELAKDNGTGWNVELEKALLRRWKGVVGLLLIISQYLGLDTLPQATLMLGTQPEKKKDKAAVQKPTEDPPSNTNASEPNNASRDSVRPGESTKSRVIALVLPEKPKNGDVVTIQVSRSSSGDECVVSDTKLKVIRKPKDVRVEQPRSSVLNLLGFSSRLFAPSGRRGEPSRSPPRYDEIMNDEKAYWVDSKI